MNKNAVYLAIFGVLCVLVGVVVGAAIVRNTSFPYFGPERPSFAKRAEHFMWHGPRGTKMPKFGRGENPLLQMFTDELGLDNVLGILERLTQELGPHYRPCPLLRRKVEAGLLGKKTGRGFYTYSSS